MPEEYPIQPDFFVDHHDDSQENQVEKKKSPKTPMGLVMLIFGLAIVAVVFASNQWIKSLQFPFLIPQSKQASNLNFNGQNNDFNNLLSLSGTDTDGDGLSDYDETYLYYTSPYLEDSDSDGFNDYEEQQSGYDPNCPQGSVCQSQGSPAVMADTSAAILSQFSNLSDDELRQLLITQGLPAEEVNSLDSATLRQTFNDALANFNTPDYFADLLQNTQIELTPTQIKEILLAQGMTEAEVSQFTDEDLLLIWQQAMAQAQEAGNSLGN